MPVSNLGQLITFAVELDADEKYSNFVYVTAHRGDTIRSIAARRGHPEQAQTIAQLNGLRSITATLKTGLRLKLPGQLAQGDVLHVLADDPRPTVTAGYAKFDTVDRPGRKGINRFLGYDPIAYEIAVQFEGYVAKEGKTIEQDIMRLERMAGRGQFSGAAVGAPAIIRISVTDNTGNQVLLVPENLQWSRGNPTAPLWRISNIAWDKNALGDTTGRRVRQKATVTVTEYTPITITTRSSSTRSRARNLPTLDSIKLGSPKADAYKLGTIH